MGHGLEWRQIDSSARYADPKCGGNAGRTKALHTVPNH